MINENTFSEVYSFLNMLGYDYIIKLPEKEWQLILNKKNENYNLEYELSDFNEDKKMSNEAKYIILNYQLKYFSNLENENEEIKKILEENDKKIKEKYDEFKNERNIENRQNHIEDEKKDNIINTS